MGGCVESVMREAVVITVGCMLHVARRSMGGTAATYKT